MYNLLRANDNHSSFTIYLCNVQKYDFNINFLHDPKDSIIQRITSNGFKQIVEGPTHKEGGLLDHVYIRGVPLEFEPHIQIDFRHYTDHGAITIIKP